MFNKKIVVKILTAAALCCMLCACQAKEKENLQTEETENPQTEETEAQNTAAAQDEDTNSAGTDSADHSAGEDASGGDSGAGEDASGEDSGDGQAAEDAALKDACSDYFSLGVGINGSTLENLTTYTPEYMELVKKHFNSVTMTNLMKSVYLLRQQESQSSADGSPVLDYTCIDDTLQWCMDNGVKMRGHTLVWHTQTPAWFFREGYRDDGALVDKDTMLFRMESYICQLMGHVQENYPGVVYCWDVVNEAVDIESGDPDSFFSCRRKNGEEPNLWYDTIGPEYVEYAFTYARKYADEDVKLFYNDFNTYQPEKKNCIYLLCEDLKEKGLIDGIGMQGYWGVDYPNITAITSAITYFSQLGLEIQITELSVGVEEETQEAFEEQAARYREIFFYLRGLDTAGGGTANITNVTFFGLKDHYVETDQTNSRLFDADYQPKPAFDAVMNIFTAYYQ